MILIVDNYDSFTYNLVDYFGKITTEEIGVFRNDKISIQEITEINPACIIISPGPKAPADAGVSKEVIQVFGPRIPLLGVCLGHQAIGEVYGGEVIQAKKMMHGKVSKMSHENSLLFQNIPKIFEATRYHSLAINPSNFPKDLEILAIDNMDQEIMAVKHTTYPIYGVQFHPESIRTTYGLQMMKNFLQIRDLYYTNRAD